MPTVDKPSKSGSARSLWIGVGLLFGLMVLAWAALFNLAVRHPVASVPLEHRTAP